MSIPGTIKFSPNERNMQGNNIWIVYGDSNEERKESQDWELWKSVFIGSRKKLNSKVD